MESSSCIMKSSGLITSPYSSQSWALSWKGNIGATLDGDDLNPSINTWRWCGRPRCAEDMTMFKNIHNCQFFLSESKTMYLQNDDTCRHNCKRTLMITYKKLYLVYNGKHKCKAKWISDFLMLEVTIERKF